MRRSGRWVSTTFAGRLSRLGVAEDRARGFAENGVWARRPVLVTGRKLRGPSRSRPGPRDLQAEKTGYEGTFTETPVGKGIPGPGRCWASTQEQPRRTPDLIDEQRRPRGGLLGSNFGSAKKGFMALVD